jgi:hypothetical protein
LQLLQYALQRPALFNAASSNTAARDVLQKLTSALRWGLQQPAAADGALENQSSLVYLLESALEHPPQSLDHSRCFRVPLHKLQGQEPVFLTNVQIHPFGRIQFNSHKLRLPASSIFQGSVDRILNATNIRLHSARKHFIQTFLLEALFHHPKNAPSLHEYLCGIHTDYIFTTTDPSLEDEMLTVVDYFLTPLYRQKLQSEPQLSGRDIYAHKSVSCVLYTDKMEQPRDDLMTLFRILVQQQRPTLVQRPGLRFIALPINVCLTNGFKWKFIRLYPDRPWFVDHGFTQDANVEEVVAILKSDTSPSPTDHKSFALEMNKLVQRYAFHDQGVECNIDLQRRTEDGPVNVSLLESDVLDIALNDGEVILAVLRWWLRGMVPPELNAYWELPTPPTDVHE